MLDQSQNNEAAPKLSVKTPPVVAAEASASSPAKAIQPTPYEAMDRADHAGVAKATSGLAPSELGEAWMDWAVHPGHVTRQTIATDGVGAAQRPGALCRPPSHRTGLGIP